MGEDDGSRFALAIKHEIQAVDEALTRFSQRQFATAQAAFRALAQEAEAAGHGTRAHGYRFLADTAREYSHMPLPSDWDGTIIMLEK